jgi:hypothetical protein
VPKLGSAADWQRYLPVRPSACFIHIDITLIIDFTAYRRYVGTGSALARRKRRENATVHRHKCAIVLHPVASAGHRVGGSLTAGHRLARGVPNLSTRSRPRGLTSSGAAICGPVELLRFRGAPPGSVWRLLGQYHRCADLANRSSGSASRRRRSPSCGSLLWLGLCDASKISMAAFKPFFRSSLRRPRPDNPDGPINSLP